MPNYYYEARKQDGSKVTGQRAASSEETVASSLFQEKLVPIKIEERKNLFTNIRLPTIGRKVPLEEMLMFCQQMYTMNRSGIPIVTGVARIADTSDNPFLCQTLRDIVEQLSAGKTLATAMGEHPKIFSNLFVNVVQVGENSGSLDEAFLQLSDFLKLEESTVRRFKTAFRYPIFVLTSIFAAILIINAFVVPAFARMFEQFNTELPLPTRLLIGFSNFITGYWYFLLIGLVIISIGIYYYLKTPTGKMNWHRSQLKIKIIGPILKRILLARFARTFAIILKTGVPLAEGLQLVANAMGNVYMKQKIQEMHDGITRGDTISTAATNIKMFTPLVLQMLAVGEETGNIDQMLEDVAEFYERQVDYDLSRLSDAIEPVLIVVLGIMVLILALGVFLPMWNMVRFARG